MDLAFFWASQILRRSRLSSSHRPLVMKKKNMLHRLPVCARHPPPVLHQAPALRVSRPVLLVPLSPPTQLSHAWSISIDHAWCLGDHFMSMPSLREDPAHGEARFLRLGLPYAMEFGTILKYTTASMLTFLHLMTFVTRSSLHQPTWVKPRLYLLPWFAGGTMFSTKPWLSMSFPPRVMCTQLSPYCLGVDLSMSIARLGWMDFIGHRLCQNSSFMAATSGFEASTLLFRDWEPTLPWFFMKMMSYMIGLASTPLGLLDLEEILVGRLLWPRVLSRSHRPHWRA